MEGSYRKWLSDMLKDRESLGISQQVVDELHEYLDPTLISKGVCSGCHTGLKRFSKEGKVVIQHVLNDPEPNCDFLQNYDTVPEWAFFPQELFEE